MTDPLDMALAHLLDVFQGERARSQVARIGIVLTTLHQKTLEVIVADDCFATYDGMSLSRNGGRNAADGRCQMGDVSADMPVATCDNLCQLTIVVGDNQCQTIQFPRNPDGLLLGPFDKFCSLLGLSQ